MLETKLLKERKDSLQITRYLIDKMGEGNELGWLSMLGGGDEEVSDYGMSMNQLNGIRFHTVSYRDNKVDELDRLGW
jgi:hypothetical protein